jgi:hypothetical protein
MIEQGNRNEEGGSWWRKKRSSDNGEVRETMGIRTE